MDTRFITLKEYESFDANATEIISLDLQDNISQILIETWLDTDAAGSMTAHPSKSISNIELIDGSEVLESFDGSQCEALDWYQTYTNRSPFNMALIGNSVRRTMAINFGRYLYDEKYNFDPTKFKNPQLRITMDVDASMRGQDQVGLKVMANVFDEKRPNSEGFLSLREVKTYQMAASSHEYTNLPVDLPYRGLLIQCQTLGTEPSALLEYLKLSQDQDKHVIMDNSIEDIFRSFGYYNTPIVEHWLFSIGLATRYIMCMPTTRVTAMATQWRTAVMAREVALYDGDGGRLRTICETGDTNYQVQVMGWLPHGCYYIPLHGDDSAEGYFKPPTEGNLKLDMTAGGGAAAGNITKILTHQLRSY